MTINPCRAADLEAECARLTRQLDATRSAEQKAFFVLNSLAAADRAHAYIGDTLKLRLADDQGKGIIQTLLGEGRASKQVTAFMGRLRNMLGVSVIAVPARAIGLVWLARQREKVNRLRGRREDLELQLDSLQQQIASLE